MYEVATSDVDSDACISARHTKPLPSNPRLMIKISRAAGSHPKVWIHFLISVHVAEDKRVNIVYNYVLIGLTKGSIPFGQRRVKSQIYDSLVIGGSSKYKQKRISAPGLFLGFDSVEEKEEGKEDSLVKDVMEEVNKRLEVDSAKTDGGTQTADDMGDKKGAADLHNGGEYSSKDQPSSPIIDENEEWAKVSSTHFEIP